MALENFHSWLYNFSALLNLGFKTLELSILFLHEFILVFEFSQNIDDEIQLSAIAALTLAIKVEERFSLEYKEIQKVVNCNYEIERLLG